MLSIPASKRMFFVVKYSQLWCYLNSRKFNELRSHEQSRNRPSSQASDPAFSTEQNGHERIASRTPRREEQERQNHQRRLHRRLDQSSRRHGSRAQTSRHVHRLDRRTRPASLGV